MIQNYIKQILSLYNYIDAVVMVNDKGVIEYSDNFRTDINNLYKEEVIGRYIWEVYPELNKESSSLLRAMKTGTAILNEKQHLINYKGVEIDAVNSTFPIRSKDKIVGAVEVSLYIEPKQQRKEINLKLKDKNNPGRRNYNIDDIITCNKTMLDIKKKILKVSKTDSNVLIYGSTGTGKEMIAQSIHQSSMRASGTFISQNCAAIPSTLLESILFGTVKGSFTGAENRKGLFEASDGGTLFLDEINSMEIALQAKILKAIENQEIRRVGSTEVIKIDVRIICAINEMPSKLIHENKMREDLFYRIGVIQINLPELKERKDDIEVLCKNFIKLYNKKMNKNIIDFDDQVKRIFKNYDWPGNVRELRNVIEAAFILTSSDIITTEDLPDYMFAVRSVNNSSFPNYIEGQSLNELVEAYEKDIIKKVLENSRTLIEAANTLKISRQTLKYKMMKYNTRQNFLH